MPNTFLSLWKTKDQNVHSPTHFEFIKMAQNVAPTIFEFVKEWSKIFAQHIFEFV
jgi:hypothetical protein